MPRLEVCRSVAPELLVAGAGPHPMLPTSHRPARVLLAEDDDSLRSVLVDVLRADGRDVIAVHDGRQLFWEVERVGGAFDLVISDLRMPSYNGLEVLEAWADAGSAPRVILMSAFPDPEVRKRAEALGAQLLEKPISIPRFRAAVNELLSREKKGVS